uniref:Uncharacterized protein n=1 Tax=viral metagenome TaxID=1070528 RepID=A0A6C0E6C5_9ZZZZ
MSNIQSNIDLLLSLLDHASKLKSSTYIDVEDIIQKMNNDIGLLKNEYDGVLLGSLINPLFRILNNAVITCKYAEEYINIVYEKGLLIDENHLIISKQMIKPIEILADEIHLLKGKLCNH